MIGLQLLAVMALVAVNGFFAAAEFSLVAVRASNVRQLIEQGDARARIVQELLGQLDRVVSGVQVGVTLASLGLGALGESTLASIFRPMLAWLPVNRAAVLAHGAALALAFALLTVMHVVFGELVPKTISLERAGRASLLIARPFYWYLNAFRPAIGLLESLSRRVVRALGVSPSAGHSVPHSAEELQIQIQQARERGILAASEERFMLGAMELGQLRVREIMVPRPDVHALPVTAQLAETLALFATTQRSRLPVYEGTLDHILGFVHIKDMLWVLLALQRRDERRDEQGRARRASIRPGRSGRSDYPPQLFPGRAGRPDERPDQCGCSRAIVTASAHARASFRPPAIPTRGADRSRKQARQRFADRDAYAARESRHDRR